MIKWKQEAMGFQNYGLDYKKSRFCRLSPIAMEQLVTDQQVIEGFKTILNSCLETDGVHVIDLAV